MNLFLTGARGQVGHELASLLSPLGAVRALDRSQLDLRDLDALRSVVRSDRPDVIVNAAAYTRVDQAEGEEALARRINAEMPAVLAEEAARVGALLVHYSTDYVFDGTARRAYTESDAEAPINVYGATKLEGDSAILASDAQAWVFRVGWVYGRRGHNFLETIQRLARTRDELRVVADQHGSPTWSRAIARATVAAITRWIESRGGSGNAPKRGLYHMAAPDFTSWHEFASTIVGAMPLVAGSQRRRVTPITTSEYPTAAARPLWTVMKSGRLRDEFGIVLPPWREQLSECLAGPP